jgi:hypothetical protein
MQQEGVKISSEPFLPLEYGDTKLPHFSREEKIVRDIPYAPDQFWGSIHLRRNIETLSSLQGSRALREIDEIVDGSIARLLSAQKINPALNTRAQKVIQRKEWAGVEPNSGEHFALRELIAKANRIKYALVARWIESAPETGLTPVAKAEYLSLGPAMAALDRMYLKMVAEPVAIDSDERGRRGLKDEGAVVRMVGGEAVEVPMHKAYPEETEAIVRSYKKLLTELLQMERMGKADGGTVDPESLIARKIPYYQAVLRAFESSSHEDWLKADTLLPQQIVDGSDVIHIHSIEVGYMDDRHVRAPEISLRAPDLEAIEAQRLSMETKERMIRMMGHDSFADIPTMNSSQALVRRSNATARHVLGAGMEMDLKMAGQILPNEMDTRVNGGIDTSLDSSTIRTRQPSMNTAFIAVFGEEAFRREYEPRLDAEKYLGGTLASHEFGHAIGLNSTTQTRLGHDLANPYIEEWKASAGGLVFNTWLPYTEGENDIEDVRTKIVDKLTGTLRYSADRGKAAMLPYYRESIMFMNAAEESGVVKAPDAQETYWHIDLKEEKVRKFCEIVAPQYHEVLRIYDKGERLDLKSFLSKNLVPGVFVDDVAEILRDPSRKTPLPTPAELTKLPA